MLPVSLHVVAESEIVHASELTAPFTMTVKA
jgi:hypothetical protein